MWNSFSLCCLSIVRCLNEELFLLPYFYCGVAMYVFWSLAEELFVLSCLWFDRGIFVFPCLCFVVWQRRCSCCLVCALWFDRGDVRVVLFVFCGLTEELFVLPCLWFDRGIFVFPCLCFVVWQKSCSCCLVCVLKLDRGMFRVALFMIRD